MNNGARDQLYNSEDGHAREESSHGSTAYSEIDNDDCVDTYGATVLRHFKKQDLEREYHMHKRPSLLTTQMKFLLLLAEISIIALIAVTIHWIVVARKEAIDLDAVWDSVRGEEWGGSYEDSEKKLNTHMIIFLGVFVLLLPHVLFLTIILDTVAPIRLVIFTVTLKTASFFLFFGGVADIESAARKNHFSRDYKLHELFASGLSAVFTLYITLSAISLAGRFWKQMFHLRLIGHLLKVSVSDWFMDVTDHILYGVAYLSLLTGFNAYLFVIRDRQHFRKLEEVATNAENWHIRSIVILIGVLYAAILLACTHKHFVRNHKFYLTAETFEKVFLRFKDLYEEEDIMKMGQDMPKVTTPQRMV